MFPRMRKNNFSFNNYLLVFAFFLHIPFSLLCIFLNAESG